MAVLTSSGVFPIADASLLVASVDAVVLPSVAFPNGTGRIVHPLLGSFTYQYKPDEWVNLDGDILIAPTWAATKTMKGAAHSLWLGDIADITVEERWLAPEGLCMPISQLRMLLNIWTTPVDPATGYVEWYPTYANNIGYYVIPLDLVVGSAGGSNMGKMQGFGSQAIVLDDLVNALNPDCSNNGWVTQPVTFFLKLVSKI